MTFDFAQEAFQANPNKETAQNYLNSSIEYYEDDMIGEDTFNSATNELAIWANETNSKLIDPRFEGKNWN